MSPFETLYLTYFKRVYAYLLSRVHNQAVAEDLAAAAWQKAYTHFGTFDGQKGSFVQWIFTIARNETNMYWRLYWVKHVFSLGETQNEVAAHEPTPAQTLEEQQFRTDLLTALKDLSSKERDLVALKFYSGLNNRQIAALAQLSESNVGTILHRALQKMRGKMEK